MQPLLVISVMNHWKLDHELMYAQAWGFEFAPPGTKGHGIWNRGDLGPRLYYRNEDRIFLNLYLFHGVQVYQSGCESIDQLYKLLEEQLEQDLPVIVFIDTYYLPWMESFYQKIHSIHSVLVTGMALDKGLYCNDTPPFFSRLSKTSFWGTTKSKKPSASRCIFFEKVKRRKERRRQLRYFKKRRKTFWKKTEERIRLKRCGNLPIACKSTRFLQVIWRNSEAEAASYSGPFEIS